MGENHMENEKLATMIAKNIRAFHNNIAITWVCSFCGHEWKADIPIPCPVCNPEWHCDGIDIKPMLDTVPDFAWKPL